MTRGGRICLFSSLRSSRLAACLLRRRCTRTSSTTPAWSTARQSQCFTPAILSTTSSRCHLSPTRGGRRRIWLANCWPNDLETGGSTGYVDVPSPCGHAGGLAIGGDGMLYVADTHTRFATPLARAFDRGARFRQFSLG